MPSIADTLNQAWANDTNKFGYKMLLKMGWKEGKGLGKNEDGMESHIKVSKQVDNLGIGCETDGAGNVAFTSQIQNFAQVLASLNETTEGAIVPIQKKKSKKSKKDKKEKKKKKKAREQQDKEAKKQSSKRKRSVSSDDDDSDSDDEDAKPKIYGKIRYSKIKRAKDVANYSSLDLKAILGGHSS